MTHQEYMKCALELALKGQGFVSPNPLVGAVIVKNNKIIGQGYHEKYGSLHAERNALASCSESYEGADIYVTLEPCCHHGKQPPCTDALISAKIKRVFIGSLDPNPLVSGKGIEILRKHGIEVITDILKDECDAINKIFFHYIQTKLPYVSLKYAMTMDGKIAAYTGNSKWITNSLAREHVHQLRHTHTAIMVGINTVLEDDPLLNCRIENGRDPIRIICDTNLRTPLTSNIVLTANKIPTIIATKPAFSERFAPYKAAGCEILEIPTHNDHIDFKILMTTLGKKGIDSILLEGGGQLHWAAVEANMVNKVYTYIAPKIIGGKNALSPVSGLGFPYMSQALALQNTKILQLGNDILLESEVEHLCLQE